jgi:endonuclease/exonuclease/phosphatase family metal-dependent hydrolase
VTAAQKASDSEFTYTNYDTEEDPCRLDYMLFSEGLTAETYRILTEQYDGYISDHYGACAQFRFH